MKVEVIEQEVEVIITMNGTEASKLRKFLGYLLSRYKASDNDRAVAEILYTKLREI